MVVEFIYDRQPILSMEASLCMNMQIFIAENRQNGKSHEVIAAGLYTQDDTGFFFKRKVWKWWLGKGLSRTSALKSCWLFIIRMHISILKNAHYIQNVYLQHTEDLG